MFRCPAGKCELLRGCQHTSTMFKLVTFETIRRGDAGRAAGRAAGAVGEGAAGGASWIKQRYQHSLFALPHALRTRCPPRFCKSRCFSTPAEGRHSWLQLAREAAEAKEAASALAEENQTLIAKVQRLVPPPDRAGSSASDSRDGSPTKVRHTNYTDTICLYTPMLCS